jgi:hypothetical protein
MIEYPNRPGYYSAILIENEFSKHPLVLDVMMQIRLPDGKVLNCRIERDLSEWLLGTKDKEYIAKAVASNLSYSLLETIREDVASKLEKTIWERIKNRSCI